jgi:hypothetical protein
MGAMHCGDIVADIESFRERWCGCGLGLHEIALLLLLHAFVDVFVRISTVTGMRLDCIWKEGASDLRIRSAL